MRILLIEPYYAGSHRAWADGFASHSTHEIRLLTLPGRWWKWRMRGAGVTLARELESLGGWVPEVVLVSDMIDLAHFKALARPFLGDVPIALYFHETQLTYPDPPGSTPDDSYGFTNWVSALAADRVFFNSGYHRDIFFETLPRLLKRFPDHKHLDLVPEVERRSEVLPVGVDMSWIGDRSPSSDVPRVVWNHRWEFDKQPEVFADAVAFLVEKGLDFELILLGPRAERTPEALTRVRDAAGDRIVHDGEASTEEYRSILSSADIVVSCATQEFFGISVVEAMAAGCRPVLPDRLSYPWLIPAEYHDQILYEGDLGPALASAVADPKPPPGLAESMRRFSWDTLAHTYDGKLDDLAV